MTTLTTDILVIGAGPGGSAAAWGLAAAGREVLLVDAAEFPRDKTCGDGLPPMAIGTLRAMGALAKVEAAGAQRIETVSLRGPHGTTARMGFAEAMGEGYYALVMPRFTLDDILRQHAVDAGATFRGRTRITEVERWGRRITKVHTADLTIEAQWVVVAVGANMGFLRKTEFPYSDEALVRAVRGYFKGVRPLRQDYAFTFEAGLLPGYGWVFPTGPDTANIGVGVDARHATARSTTAMLTQFVERLHETGIIEHAEMDGPPKGYPIRIDFPSGHVAGPNWMLIGEATGLVNPATGEGIDLALESGLMAARAIEAGRPQQYGRQLRRRYAAMFRGLNLARSMFMNERRLDRVIRLMNRSPYVKRRVINVTQGYEPPMVMFNPRLIGAYLGAKFSGL